MENIYKWALSVIGCTVIASIAELLITDEKYEKVIKTVIGSFILCAILFPLTGFIKDIREPEFHNNFIYESEDDPIGEMESKIINDKLSKTAEDILIQNGIIFLETNVWLEYDENGTADKISCNISIPGTERNKIPEIKKIINEKIGTEPHIICISSNE